MKYLAGVLLVPTSFLVNSWSISGADTSSDCLHNCVVSLMLPRTSNGLDPRWLGDKHEADARITIVIGKSGRPEKVEVSAPTSELRNFTAHWIEQSRFSPKCAGAKHSLLFRYKVYRTPVALHLPAVTMQSCERFLLEFEEPRPPGPLIPEVRD